MNALETAMMIKNKDLTVADTVKSFFDAVRKKEPELNAFITIADEEEAMKEAAKVQKGIEDGLYSGPLAGIPIAVKDNICTKGMRTTCGSKILENFIPTYDSTAVEHLKNAGCIIIGKTNLDEFAMGSTTETGYFGATHNPLDSTRVAGGSSGGSAAATVSGEVDIALGSDTGGSIRQPASYCGLTAIKPTYGTVSRYGLTAYASSMDQIGPMANNVADCTALLDVISGYDGRDSTSIRRDTGFFQVIEELDSNVLCDSRVLGGHHSASGGMNPSATESTPLKGLKIGLLKGDFRHTHQNSDRSATTSDEKDEYNIICQAVEACAHDFEKLGATVEEFTPGLIDLTVPAYYVIACAEASSNLERFDGVKYGFRTEEYDNIHHMYRLTRSEGFGEEVKRRIMLGTFVLSSGYYDEYYLQALKVRRMIKESYDKAFEKYDMILSPVSPTLAPKLGESLRDPIKMYQSDIYTVPANLLGLPAISFPCGVSNGLPIGAQLMSRPLSESTLIKTVYMYEQLLNN